MKVHVVVTDGEGHVFEGDATLVTASGVSRARRTPNRKEQGPSREKLDFSLPVRSFMKRHARSLRGPQKFTVLLARLAGGKVGVATSLKSIKDAWNKMTEPMGGVFNAAHPTRAKDSGWVDTTKRGFYVLRVGWHEVLKEG